MQWSKGVLEWADISVEKLGTSLDHVAFTIVYFLPIAFSWPNFHLAPLFPAGHYTLHAHNTEQGQQNVDRAESLHRCPPLLISFSRELADHNGTPSCQIPLVTSPGLSSFPSKVLPTSACQEQRVIFEKKPPFQIDFKTLADSNNHSKSPNSSSLLINKALPGEVWFAFVWHQVSSLNLTSGKEKRKGEEKMASMGPFQSMIYGDPNFSGSISNVKRKKLCAVRRVGSSNFSLKVHKSTFCTIA